MTSSSRRTFIETAMEWASRIPDDWDVVALKHVCAFTTGWTPPSGDAEAYVGENLWANISDLGSRTLYDTAKRISDEAIDRHGMSPSPVGSLLFSFKLSIGQVSFVGNPMFTNEAIATFLPSEKLSLAFAYYAFPEMVPKNASENIYGAKMLNQQLIQSAQLVLPPRSEQIAIAEFLDRETGKIDALVEEQTRLIELLKEKRQAVISHAVTKGLNPNAPMKDTGIESIGLVPEHWDVVPLKFLVSHVVDCLHTTPTYEGDPLYPAIRTADVERGRLLLDQARCVSEEIYLERIQRLKPEPGDILYSREGERFGMAALVPEGTQLCLGQRMMMFRASPAMCPTFIMWALNSEPFYQEVLARAAGSTSPHANISDLINFRLPCPRREEQGQIAAFIEREADALDALIAQSASATELLKERRSALISAAVTGKIDVRGQSTSTVVTPDFRQSRKLVAAKIVEDLSGQKTFGRVKLQKLLYLAEAHGGIHELSGHYVREAAGPLDRDMVREVETALQASGHVVIDQPEGRGTAVNYQLRGTRGAFQAELETLLGHRTSVLSELIGTVGALDTRGAEAVATLYAVWNDALASGTVPSDDEIIREVLDDWHPKKAETFTVADLKRWLAWMRRNGLKPKGNAPVTSTGRLFV
ncbi:hypothetical protein GOD58_16630 [Sinorhizobium medicae]|nr:hypothetical protein [Sinorhizobium medicae]